MKYIYHCTIIVIAHFFSYCCQRDSSEKYLEKIMMVKGSTTTRLASENASKDDCNVCLEDDMTVEVFLQFWHTKSTLLDSL